MFNGWRVVDDKDKPGIGVLELDLRQCSAELVAEAFKFDLSKPKERRLATALHFRMAMHDHTEIWRDVTHDAKPVHDPTDWPVPCKGQLSFTYAILKLGYGPLNVGISHDFELIYPWQRLIAHQVVAEQRRRFGRLPSCKLDGKSYGLADEVDVLKLKGLLALRNLVIPPAAAQPFIVPYELNLAFGWHLWVAERLWEQSAENCSFEWMSDVQLEGQPLELPSSRSKLWRLPPAGKLTIDYTVVGDKVRHAVLSKNSHSCTAKQYL